MTSKLCHRFGTFADCPSSRLQRLLQDIDEHPGRDDDRAKRERTDPRDLFALAADEVKTEQKHGSDADRNGSENPARHAERTPQPRLANSKNNESSEFQRET